MQRNLKKRQEEHRLAMQEAERKAALDRVRESENARIEQELRLKEKIDLLKKLDIDSNL